MLNSETHLARIEIYDTTLRDGSQGEGISFSVEDKIRIARRLDEFGMDYIEGGWPGSNPKDEEFFARMLETPLQRAKLAAFGSTRRAGIRADADAQVAKLIAARTPVVTIFGKTWDDHIRHALHTTSEENLLMIADTVSYLKSEGREVIYDAEHFFDGYRTDPDYALCCLRTAAEAGASRLVLCDTNGGTMPGEMAALMQRVQAHVSGVPLGIHTHNDAECAVANALIAVQNGATQVQGTVNGYGERCGNCNLIAVVASLQLKLGYDCLLPESMRRLTGLSQYVDEVANLTIDSRRAYVGRSAFAHKGGVHADAVLKGACYEHIDPEQVGNTRRLLVSELAGSSSMAGKAAEYGVDLNRKSPEARALLKAVTEREHGGYSYEGAEGSFELLLMRTLAKFRDAGAPADPAAAANLRRTLQDFRELFDLKGLRCIVEKRGAGEETVTEATLKIVVDGTERLTVAEGDGPVHALDGALRKALLEFYPEVALIRLTDFKVRVVNSREGTAAQVRVIITSADGDTEWSTVGVSTNVIEASWDALADSVAYGILRAQGKQPAD